VKLTFDRSLCQGHNRCVMVAPSLFTADDDGYAVALVSGEVPIELEGQAILAADNCPEYAITAEP